MRVEVCLRIKRMFSKNEKDDLIDIFHKSYVEQAGHEIDYQILNFYIDDKNLGNLRYCSRYQFLEEGNERERIQHSFEQAINHFKMRLMNLK